MLYRPVRIKDPKDPSALLDYALEYGPEYLREGEVLTASSWAVDNAELVIESDSFTTDQTVVWVSGGVDRGRYVLTNTFSTNFGVTDDERSMILKVRNR